MMRIGIDIRPYLTDKSGMGQYVFQLTKHLLESDTKNSYVLFADRAFDIPEIKGNFTKKIYTFPIEKLTTLWFHFMTILQAKRECDVYLTTSALYVPTFHKNFALVVVHDLTIFTFPETHTQKTKILIGTFLKFAVQHAKAVITVSKATKLDLLKQFPKLDASKVFPIYMGRNDELTSLAEPLDPVYWQMLEDKFKVYQPYIICVGTTQPRKNIIRLLEAYKTLNVQHPEVRLVIAGKKGWGYEEIEQYIEKNKLSNDVIITSNISDKEKAYLLKQAVMLVYPSLYEGFGMPVLEAMSFGIPVITSKTSSLPEVAGSAAILIDPYNVQDLYENMIKLLEDKGLQTSLVENEKEQVQQFDWKNTADSIIQLYTYGSKKN